MGIHGAYDKASDGLIELIIVRKICVTLFIQNQLSGSTFISCFVPSFPHYKIFCGIVNNLLISFLLPKWLNRNRLVELHFG